MATIRIAPCLRPLLALLVLRVLLPAQQSFDLEPTMQRMSAAMTSLQKACDARQRKDFDAPLAILRTAIEEMRSAKLELPSKPSATEALHAMSAAIADLAHPIGDGVASDPFDLAALRRGCTSCHLANRDDNDQRGLYPNLHGAVAGRLQLFGLDQAEREDRSGVVVFLESAGADATPLLRNPSISQRGRQFHPAVLAVTKGTTVRFPNDDVVFHNVFSLSRSNPFDLGSYPKGQERERVLTTPGLVKVHCNIHPDMIAHVLVLNTPLFAVSDESGHWSIPEVLPGDYNLRVWHSLAAEQRLPVTVTNTALLVPLEVRETKPRVQHPNKHGRTYPKKY